MIMHMTTLCFEFLVVHAGPICVHIMIESFNSAPNNAFFLGYSNMHKGFKCIDVSTGRVYISRDVVFDEQVFPFAKLHPNAGALLRSQTLLLADSIPTSPSTDHGGIH